MLRQLFRQEKLHLAPPKSVSQLGRRSSVQPVGVLQGEHAHPAFRQDKLNMAKHIATGEPLSSDSHLVRPRPALSASVGCPCFAFFVKAGNHESPVGARRGSPDTAGVLRVHRGAFLAAESLAELVEVFDRAIHSPFPRGMRIREGSTSRGLFAHVLAPNLAKGEKVPLRRRVAVDLRRGRAGFLG